jgi:D-alanine-D-alanine ligase
MSKLRVAVLMGGTSAERDISLWTGKQILGALDRSRYTVYAIDTATGQKVLPDNENVGLMFYSMCDRRAAVTTLAELPLVDDESRPDVVMIALHGPGGEDGTVQGMLELLKIPYTGSGVLASALAMDKAMTKRVITAGGVRMPRDITLFGPADPNRETLAALGLPVVIKPNSQGSTIGMSIVRDVADLDSALTLAFKHDSTVIIEEFVEGVEITVPILGNDELEILPIVEIVPHSGFYDYEAKYTHGATDEICPARISNDVANEARSLARRSHELLGCRGMSRTDMIVDAAGKPWVLEVNTIPGMTPLSLLPLSASVAGYSFCALLDRLIELALSK